MAVEDTRGSREGRDARRETRDARCEKQEKTRSASLIRLINFSQAPSGDSVQKSQTSRGWFRGCRGTTTAQSSPKAKRRETASRRDGRRCAKGKRNGADSYLCRVCARSGKRPRAWRRASRTRRPTDDRVVPFLGRPTPSCDARRPRPKGRGWPGAWLCQLTHPMAPHRPSLTSSPCIPTSRRRDHSPGRAQAQGAPRTAKPDKADALRPGGAPKGGVGICVSSFQERPADRRKARRPGTGQ
jgi:hypothetical protein